MPFKYSGTNLTQVKYNGVELTKVTYNGTVVFEPFIYYGYQSNNNLYKYNINLSTLVATGSNSLYFRIHAILSDGDFLYIYSDSSRRIHKVEKTLPLTQIAQTSSSFSMQSPNAAVFYDGTNIYALRFADSRRLSRYSTSTLAVEQTGNSQFSANIRQIMVDSTHVYVAMSSNSRVSRIDKTNLSATIQNADGGFASSFSFTMDNDFIYAIRNDGNRFYRIQKSNFLNSGPVGAYISVGLGLSLTNVEENGMVVVDANHLYFIARSTADASGRLVRTNLIGGDVTVSTFNTPTKPRRIQLFGNKIYIACDNRTFVIIDKLNINSGTSFQLANPNDTGADMASLLVE
jgi:hypothetical protein